MMPNIQKALRRFAPKFIEAREAGLSEADTVQRLCKFFEEVLGYDGLEDISREVNLKNKYVDVCLKVDGRIRLLVEAKAANLKLRDRHIEQAQAYASQNNYRWVLLTNGVDWNFYHLTFDEGIEYERAFCVSLETPEFLEDAASKLCLLHKQAVKKGALEDFWEKTAALAAGSIGKALFNQRVLMLIRREIRRDTGLLIDVEDLAKAIHEMLCQEARDNIGPVRIRKPRRSGRRVQVTAQTNEPAEAAAIKNSPPSTGEGEEQL